MLAIGAGFVVVLSFAIRVSLNASQSMSLKLREGSGRIRDWGRSKWVTIGKWSVDVGLDSARTLHCVMYCCKLSEQNILSGCEYFFVCI